MGVGDPRLRQVNPEAPVFDFRVKNTEIFRLGHFSDHLAVRWVQRERRPFDHGSVLDFVRGLVQRAAHTTVFGDFRAPA